jgi:hypothetical protein
MLVYFSVKRIGSLTLRFSCGARKVQAEQGCFRKMQSRRQLQAPVGRRTLGSTYFLLCARELNSKAMIMPPTAPKPAPIKEYTIMTTIAKLLICPIGDDGLLIRVSASNIASATAEIIQPTIAPKMKPADARAKRAFLFLSFIKLNYQR